MVGDPTGRSSEKPALSTGQIETNSVSISRQICQIFNNFSKGSIHQLPDLKVVDNSQWFSSMSLLQFLTKVGRNVKVNSMLAKNW